MTPIKMLRRMRHQYWQYHEQLVDLRNLLYWKIFTDFINLNQTQHWLVSQWIYHASLLFILQLLLAFKMFKNNFLITMWQRIFASLHSFLNPDQINKKSRNWIPVWDINQHFVIGQVTWKIIKDIFLISIIYFLTRELIINI